MRDRLMLDNDLTYSYLESFLSGLYLSSDVYSLVSGAEVAVCLHELHACGLDGSLPSGLRFSLSRLESLFGVLEEAFACGSAFVCRCDLLYGMYLLSHSAVGSPFPSVGSKACVGFSRSCSTGLSELLDAAASCSESLHSAALDRVLVMSLAPYGAVDSRCGRLLESHLRFYALSQRSDGGWPLGSSDGGDVALRRLEVLRLNAMLLGDLSYDEVLSLGERFYGVGVAGSRSHAAVRHARDLSSAVFSCAEASAFV